MEHDVTLTDIWNIALNLRVTLTDEDVYAIQDAYPAEQSWNPDVIWYNVLEDMIYDRVQLC